MRTMPRAFFTPFEDEKKKVARGSERNQNEHIVKVHNVRANAGLRLELRASCFRAER